MLRCSSVATKVGSLSRLAWLNRLAPARSVFSTLLGNRANVEGVAWRSSNEPDRAVRGLLLTSRHVDLRRGLEEALACEDRDRLIVQAVGVGCAGFAMIVFAVPALARSGATLGVWPLLLVALPVIAFRFVKPRRLGCLVPAMVGVSVIALVLMVIMVAGSGR